MRNLAQLPRRFPNPFSGGAQDVENFRENIKHGYLPLPTDVTFEVGTDLSGQLCANVRACTACPLAQPRCLLVSPAKSFTLAQCASPWVPAQPTPATPHDTGHREGLLL